MLADITNCPKCSRALPLEQGHKTGRDEDGSFETRIVCTDCCQGWYTCWEHQAGGDRPEITIDYQEKTEPEAYGRFVREVEQLTGLTIDVCSFAA